ncbi:amino acid ABC transporter substrate-binding protein [Burkholderia sp. SCN-KJ]|uniref:amino acid ABC transporter substrate-binding protein n=1 Tax=Burkholderia sp. SCN-KJ TaxID=2969248 RepID=UPI00215027AB|nr:amino acid ABC transporter substrate-binding protein [Burkholderia sp. SCN-KJ]MCR4470028.1 amino acid ABC transporter substrate-binding protein [Burkholderia sp. SCN-KJ]
MFPHPGTAIAAYDRFVPCSTSFELNVASYRHRKAGNKVNPRHQFYDDNPAAHLATVA